MLARAAGPIVLSIDIRSPALELVGGKGRALAALTAVTMPVPAGFMLTTQAYREFVSYNDLDAVVARAGDADTPSIAAAFERAQLPPRIGAALTQAYTGLGDGLQPVAVRSSATAEDLPELSFAGQQETFLNVRGARALSHAVVRCWASLWAQRAVIYRREHDVPDAAVAMAVVVQIMVPAETAGVAFTANPATGARDELVVEAGFGLGEAVVSGRITPDSYRLDRSDFTVREARPGDKALLVEGLAGGGVHERVLSGADRTRPVLTDSELTRLAKLAVRVEAAFDGVPQDIEWAFSAGSCWLLQARPITNLPRSPLDSVQWLPPEPGEKLVRRQVVENMPEPLSPLFTDVYLTNALDRAIDGMLEEMNLPVSVDVFVRRPLFVAVNGFAYCRASYHLSRRALMSLPKIIGWYFAALPRLLRTMVDRWRHEALPRYLVEIYVWRRRSPAGLSEAELLEGVRALALADARYWFDAVLVIGAAKITDAMLQRFVSSRLVPGALSSAPFLRGFPSRTLAAQESLEEIARQVAVDDGLLALVLETPASALPAALAADPAGHPVRAALARHLEEFGQQVYNLDFAHATQAEAPEGLLVGLRSLVTGAAAPGQPPDGMAVRRERLTLERDRLVSETLATLGPVRRWVLAALLRWAQRYGPYREDALFHIGAGWSTLRALALELGARLAADGVLQQADDVFFCRAGELEAAISARSSGVAAEHLGAAAVERRSQRDAQQRLHPPPMVPEHSHFRFGFIDLTAFETQKRNPATASVLEGFAVSPGTVTGRASLVLTSADFAGMTPGTILVCPTTTPAWTPLLAGASALVTDIGGILAHGSIVAREYGIPAVLGTGTATRRIRHGQQISVDGDSGRVTLHD